VVNDPGTNPTRAALNLPALSPLALQPVQWTVITPDNASAVFAALKKQGRPQVLFGLTDLGYESLSEDTLMTRQYIQDQGLELQQYKNYYEPVTPPQKAK
jgi:hypothetical protein